MKKVFRYDDELPKKFTDMWMKQNDARLAPHVVEVPKAWRKATMPQLYFPKECFARAIQFVRNSRHLPQALYVYGEAVCAGINQHGWVEIDDVVFDAVQQEFYTKEGYYKSELVRPWYKFTRPATLWIDRLSKRKADYSYRWPSVLLLPWADFNNPQTIDLATAKQYWDTKDSRLAEMNRRIEQRRTKEKEQ